MITENKAKEICNKIFKLSKADETEVIIHNTFSSLTRYANNRIHQNVNTNDYAISIRAVIGKKTGIVTINQIDKYALEKAVEDVIEITKLQNDIQDLLPMPKKQKYEHVKTYFRNTVDFSPLRRAKWIKEIIEIAYENKVVVSGSFEINVDTIVIATSSGIFGYYKGTDAELSVFTLNGDRMGWAGKFTRDVSNINHIEIARRSIEKATSFGNAREIVSNDYPVILEAKAVADLISHLSFGFSALSYLEKRSWLNKRMNKKIFSSLFTLEDNVYHPIYQGLPFDFEGMPRQRITLIKDGIPVNLVYDRITAKKMKKKPTGHSLPIPNYNGAIPFNLVIEKGNKTFEEMIKSTKKGILVTALHYTNIVEPKNMVITGMTRGGTFWIENGEIAYPIKTLRFNQSIIEALSNIEMIENKQEVFKNWWNVTSSIVPSMKITRFKFTSSSKF
jgi:predicted Zn-dependent protease